MSQVSFINRLTPVGRFVLTLSIILGLWGLKWLVMDSGLVLKKETVASQEISKVALPETGGTYNGGVVAPLSMPTSTPAKINAPEVRWLCWAWNAQMGLMYANGGSKTTEGSLMAKNGVNLNITRQDDVPQMQAALIKLAKEYKSNPATTEGAHFVPIQDSHLPRTLLHRHP